MGGKSPFVLIKFLKHQAMTLGDGVLIVLVILISLIPVHFKPTARDPRQLAVAVIKVNGQTVSTVAMNRPGYFEFPFEQGTGQVEILNGAIRMLEMDSKICPQAICSDKSWIKTSADVIVCLPNRIVVTLESAEADHDMTAGG